MSDLPAIPETETYSLLREVSLAQSNRLGRKLDYLEIGTHQGGSALAVLGTGAIKRAVLVDNWSYGDKVEDVQVRLKEFLPITRILTGESREILPTLDHPFDLIFVDGDHEREPAVKDMTNALRLLSPEGIMLVDDLDHPGYKFLRHETIQFAHRNGLNITLHPHHFGVAEMKRK